MNSYLNLLSPEENLLLSLCRLSFSEIQKSEIRNLVNEVKDWDYFINLANGHGVIALSWYNISQIGCDKNIPSKYMELLHSAYYKSLTRNIFLKNLIEEIAMLAAKEEIKIVALKGNALEEMVYGNSGLRQMSDVDILVDMDKAIPLRNILLKNGFDSLPLISPLHKKILPHLKSHLPAMTRDGALIEIHVKLFEQKGNSLTEELLNNSCKTNDPDKNLFRPEPKLLFLYLLKHIINHERTKDLKLKSYLDLAVLLSPCPDTIIDDKLIVYAQKGNLTDALFEKLKILQIFWDLSFPEWLEKRIDDINPDQISEKFIWLIKHPFQDNDETRIYDVFKPFRNIPGPLNKLVFAVGYLFPSLTFMKYFYKTDSKAGALIYYPVRWWRLLRLAGGEKGIKV